jgi:uncharacterized protein (TIGR00375 family)
MRLIVDWHIHSKYSRACSRDLELSTIAKWCERKGIQIVTTGDWTHPKWFEEMTRLLEEVGHGIYALRDHVSTTRFMLTQEVSQIYKSGDKTRRVHNLLFSPSLEVCARVNAMLDAQGFNRKSDGRPILGIGSEELYKRLKEIDARIIMVPAHAWTPWYSVFGSKSGFDSLEECFGSMTPFIYAVETGLSSDPPMNRRLSALDRVSVISNSDAHSCRKLGREANVFDLSKDEVSYDTFVEILRTQDSKRFLYTIEFHPEEGKYHADGCASCGFFSTPTESQRAGWRCPSCKKPLTLGVLHRVEALADRPEGINRGIPHKYIVPLDELLAEAFSVSSVSSKKVQEEYDRLTSRVADEFALLLDTPLEQIAAHASSPDVVEAIRRMRAGEMHISPGYDGIFGTVKIFDPKEKKKPLQGSLL